MASYNRASIFPAQGLDPPPKGWKVIGAIDAFIHKLLAKEIRDGKSIRLKLKIKRNRLAFNCFNT